MDYTSITGGYSCSVSSIAYIFVVVVDDFVNAF